MQESHLTTDTIHLLRISNFPYNTTLFILDTTGGVSILFSRSTAFSKRDAQIDSEGRFIFLMGVWESQTCIIANVYVPPSFTLTVLQCLARFLSKYPQLPVYVLGDFNSAMDLSLDIRRKYCPQGPRMYTPLAKFMGELGLIDIWRRSSPLQAQFSCHSLTHSTLSRIDFAFGN